MPIPGSPPSRTIWPSPSFACSQRSNRRASSWSRPTSAVVERSVLGLEPALGRPLADDVPCPHGSRKALELDRTEVAVYEGFSQQAPRRLGNHDAAGLGEPLQPGGQVRSLTDDRPLASFSFTDQFADDDQTGCDADASGKRCTTPLS